MSSSLYSQDDIQRQERQSLDPENKYGAARLRRFERLALQVLQYWRMASVERTRDAIQIEYTDELRETGDIAVILLITPEALELRMPHVEWPHPHTPAVSSRLFKRIPLSRLHGEKALQRHLEAALAARRAEFLTCRHCRREQPLERRLRDDLCEGCAHLEHIIF